MQKYKKDYFAHYGVGEQDVLLCLCGRVAADLHHIKPKSLGGTDHHSNLIPICRECHDKAHANKEFNESLKKFKEI